MAVYNVSSAIEFIEAFERCSTDDTIEVLADLDWNSVIDEVSQTIKMNNGAGVSNVTINGNNHSFKNLTSGRIPQSGSGRVIFSFGTSATPVTNVKINNLSFLNCQMGATITRIFHCLGDVTIYNAVIQGRFKSAMFQGNVIVRDSMITCDVIDNGRPLYSGAASNTPKWQYCWIRLNSCSYEYSSSAESFASNLDGCYVEGSIGLINADSNPKVFNNTNNSCINVSAFVDSPTPNNFVVPTSSVYGQSASLINIDKLTSLTSLTEADSTTWVKCVTDAHMRDSEYLASIGFDIIP